MYDIWRFALFNSLKTCQSYLVDKTLFRLDSRISQKSLCDNRDDPTLFSKSQIPWRHGIYDNTIVITLPVKLPTTPWVWIKTYYLFTYIHCCCCFCIVSLLWIQISINVSLSIFRMEVGIMSQSIVEAFRNQEAFRNLIKLAKTPSIYELK